MVENNPLVELGKLYVQYNAEMGLDPSLRDAGKREFAKLEQGDLENRKLWQYFRDVSMRKLEEMAALLELERFDLDLGESFYEGKMQSIVEEVLEKGKGKKDADGSVHVDLAEYGLDQAYLVKSDGATTYLLRDLAKLRYVWKEYKYFRNLYVVDVRQSHHFRQLLKIAELLGWQGVKESIHIDFGFLKLPGGTMSTREGNVIALEEVVAEAQKRALAIIQEKNPELANKEQVARQVGLAALKYFDLSHNRKSDITFDWNEALSLEGNTGPYLQYTHARIHGILRRVQGIGYRVKKLHPTPDTLHPLELAVLRKLYHYPEIVEDVLNDFYPHILCQYLFELAQNFNSFYQEIPVLSGHSTRSGRITGQEKDSIAREFRLKLCRAVAQVIKNGLALLGIHAPEEM
jgi:arginyl-tRNA synthetase